MARSRQRDPIDPTERHPFGRRRFLQGAAATTAAAFPILRAGSARAGGGCDLGRLKLVGSSVRDEPSV